MSILCLLFGHKPQQGVHSGAEYMRWGGWGAVDGIGREHRSLDARCARCEAVYNAGKVHMPDGPTERERKSDAELLKKLFATLVYVQETPDHLFDKKVVLRMALDALEACGDRSPDLRKEAQARIAEASPHRDIEDHAQLADSEP